MVEQEQVSSPKRDVFPIIATEAACRYSSPLPSVKGRVVECDVRKAGIQLRAYRERVKLVITSPPYMDITDYHGDQWLRLWLLGGRMKPTTGQGKDDSRRIIELLEVPRRSVATDRPAPQRLLPNRYSYRGDSSGRGRIAPRARCLLKATGYKIRLRECRQSELKNGQKRILSPRTSAPGIEHDFRFAVC